MENQSQPQVTYKTIMVPVVIPETPQPAQETKPDPSNGTVIGALLWAAILLLAFWFITGGYEVLR